MSSIERVRVEILRLARAGNCRACIRTQQLSALFNLPEKRIKQELATLAEQKVIRLKSWDGHRMRSYANWGSADEFVDSMFGHLHVELAGPGETSENGSPFAPGK